MHFSIVCISGMLVTQLSLTTLFCLFIPLGLISNLIILGLALFAVYFTRQHFREDVKFHLAELPKNAFFAGLPIPCFLIYHWLPVSSRLLSSR